MPNAVEILSNHYKSKSTLRETISCSVVFSIHWLFDAYVNSEGEVINPQHKSMGNNAIAFVGTSGVQLGWLASQADMLAEDWKVVQI